MQHTSSFRRVATTCVATATLLLGFATAASASSSKAPSGTVTVAEGASASPNYIFPVASCSYFSVSNLNQFQELMYRPLYFFGKGSSVAVQPSLSPADLPKASNGDKTYTIDLKGWKYSNGQTIDAQSVAFFLNMYKAFTAPVGGKTPNAGDYCGYNAGYGIPDQVASVSYPDGLSGNVVVLKMTTSLNPNFMLYNQLSQITPLPDAWDVTATGPSDCATAAYNSATANTDCINVYNYLNAQSLKTNTWTSSLWQVDSGPWKLSASDALGDETFVPNTAYSGPVKAKLAEVKLKAYTQESAEVNDLETNSIQSGYVDPTDLPSGASKPGGIGPNIAKLKANYNLVTGDSWSFNYDAIIMGNNTSAPTKADQKVRNSELMQLYVRQALQDGINQAGIISHVDKNYAIPTCSPVPSDVPVSLSKPIACAYSYSTSKGLKLLESHGWKLKSGTATCEKAGKGSGECGAGIPKGSILEFKFSYLSAAASPSSASTAQDMIDSWAKEGIKIDSDPQGFNTDISTCPDEDICSWGAGWIYAPDFYPTGESLFVPGAGFNVGDYANSTMTKLVKGTDFGHTSLYTYGSFAAKNLPDLYVPNPTGTGEVSKKLKGVLPPNPLQNFMPEYLHY